MPINTQLARRQVPTTGDADDDDADGGGNQRCGRNHILWTLDRHAKLKDVDGERLAILHNFQSIWALTKSDNGMCFVIYSIRVSGVENDSAI